MSPNGQLVGWVPLAKPIVIGWPRRPGLMGGASYNPSHRFSGKMMMLGERDAALGNKPR
jgi:hypothetical protein